MKVPTLSLLAVAGLAASSAVGQVNITFDFYPGPDGILGTGDDIPIVAPSLFSAQTLQLTNEFDSVGIRFIPTFPPIDDKNEILNSSSFSTPPSHTRPNIFASAGTQIMEGNFLGDVFEVTALVGISGGADQLEAYDANGALLDSRAGDDVDVTVRSATPIARIIIRAVSGTTPTIDNLRFTIETGCYADCDTSTGVGVLDIFDFLCFGNRFAAGDPYACDCDTTTGLGVCDIFDFLCFGNAFNAGCP